MYMYDFDVNEAEYGMVEDKQAPTVRMDALYVQHRYTTTHRNIPL